MAVDQDSTRTVGAVAAPSAGLKIFINYRRDDVGSFAYLLFERLAARFGAENVFLDIKSIHPGQRWLEEIRKHGSTSTAFIALIGSRWASILAEREQSPEDDHVRGEIELALRASRRGSGMMIIPALIDDAILPKQRDVLAAVRPLLGRETVRLRLTRLDADIEHLVAILEAIPIDVEDPPPTTPGSAAPPPKAPAVPTSASPVEPRRPKSDHYEEVKEAIVDGSLITFLGPGCNSSDRVDPWHDSGGDLPDDEELAVYLAQRFGVSPEPAFLAHISQCVAVAKGPGDLYGILTATLGARAEPSSVHQFLARLPQILHEAGLPEKHQLIVTTNYDNSLEQAFDKAEEPYDLAVYMASDGGRFAHFPFEGKPTAIKIGEANDYWSFPIDPVSREASRTVILKIHGAVDGAVGLYTWQDNYVITEDDYIEYLSQSAVESIVPVQIRNKLRYGHLLFLGYAMRDWNLRVFLRRIFERRPLNASWAIQRNPDRIDEKFWQRISVDLFGMPLSDYVRELEQHLRGAQGAEPS
jgi:SIR2-like domain/TIR domain